MAYDETSVKEAYSSVTGQNVLPDTVWDIYWPIADAKVRTDRFGSDELRILAACYYIAYLASGSSTDADGRYTSVSKSIGSVSMSVSLASGSEKSNVWLDRYNALITSTEDGFAGGCSIPLPPPATGYRDAVTKRRVIGWWRHNGRL